MRPFMRWMKGKMLRMPAMITCVEAESFIIDYLEGDLPPAKVHIFEMHLKLCRECRDYLAAYKQSAALGQAVSDDPEAAATDALPEDLVKAIVDANCR